MKPIVLLSLLLGITMSYAPAHAEGGCPPGQIPYSGTDIGSCGPIPGYNQQQQPQAPAVPPPRWESRWGAIATDEPHGIVGASRNGLSEKAAKHDAIADCKSKGGVTCTMQISYSNGCGVLLVGDKTFNLNAGSTETIAVQKAMDVCKAGNASCQVYFTSCSPAQRVQ
ncbi:DUF4189 domain-containing protein [Dyella subtropica]|uniref:DUF4189 domain-containing protein n=1 Tax=Dyella subtropica TaxID=2992127 RepID=UPI00225AEAFB|nr:DUF4189 domain-containing protein [Dyella subtropica]